MKKRFFFLLLALSFGSANGQTLELYFPTPKISDTLSWGTVPDTASFYLLGISSTGKKIWFRESTVGWQKKYYYFVEEPLPPLFRDLETGLYYTPLRPNLPPAKTKKRN